MGDRHTWRACACCGNRGRIIGYGWRSTCYQRWLGAGRPDTGPPPPRPPAQWCPPAGHDIAGLLEDFELLTTVRKLSVSQAAAVLGVSTRTAQRYSARLKAASR